MIKVISYICQVLIIFACIALPITIVAWVEYDDGIIKEPDHRHNVGGGDMPAPELPFNYDVPWITDETTPLDPVFTEMAWQDTLSDAQLLVLKDVAIMYLGDKLNAAKFSLSISLTEKDIVRLSTEIAKLQGMLNVLSGSK